MQGIDYFSHLIFMCVCFTDINTLLALFHLKPPSITVERVSTEMIFSCHVDINLDKFTFQNNSEYTAKKDAIRKTYLLLGNALGISKPKLGNLLHHT